MRVNKETHNTSLVQLSIFTTEQSSATSSKNVFADIKQKQSKVDDTSVRTIKDIEIQLDNLNANSNSDNNVFPQKDSWVYEKNLNKGMIGLKSNTNICTASKDVALTTDVKKQMKRSWEIRAFLTTIIIAFQTVIITGPFLFSVCIEFLLISPMTMEIQLLFFIPYLINTLSNPFIYAWRIPEIRQEFRRLFRLNT
ncbi:ADORA2A [Mytilus coruscus]|uniref:ADORA2A n=1 Tax=Mytilus coruscus TaxID=42192 RepID=A0A6J8BCT8_MYTCO|nr:ADORA2A [Mytilus coruscus]